MAIVSQRLGLSTTPSPVRRRAWTQVRVAQAKADISFATISDLQGLHALEGEWSSLFETCGRPHQVFQTYAWLSVWGRLFIDNRSLVSRTRLAIVTGRIDGRLVLLWPLVVRTIIGFRVLSFMGEPLSQYGDALMTDDLGEAAQDMALRYAMSLPVDIVALRRVRDDAALAPLLRRRLGMSRNRQLAPVVDLTGVRDADAFEKRFPGKLRSSRRRRRRRLEELGAVTCTTYGPSQDAAAHVQTAMAFKREWASEAGVLAPTLRDPRFQQFFVTAALAGTKAPQLRVSVLRCAAETVGVAISVGCKGQLFGHVLAPRSKALGVGGILAESSIRDALAHGFDAVDLLAPADPYKLEWASASVGVGDYLAPIGLRGAVYAHLWLGFGRDLAKAGAARIRPIAAAFGRARRRSSQTKAATPGPN